WAGDIWEGDPATGKVGVHQKLEDFVGNLPQWFIDKGTQVQQWASTLLDATITWADNVWDGDPATGKEGAHVKLDRAIDSLGNWFGEQPQHIADKGSAMLEA